MVKRALAGSALALSLLLQPCDGFTAAPLPHGLAKRGGAHGAHDLLWHSPFTRLQASSSAGEDAKGWSAERSEEARTADIFRALKQGQIGKRQASSLTFKRIGKKLGFERSSSTLTTSHAREPLQWGVPRFAQTFVRQIPKEPIDSGMQAPSKEQLLDKIKGEAIPWLVAGLLTVPLSLASKSVLPAVIIATVDIVWFIYTYLQALKMNTPAKPEPVSRDLLELWENCLTESPDGPEDFVTGWFYDAPLASLAREDIEDWLAWGCFCTTWEKLEPQSKEAVGLVLDMIEERLEHEFPMRGPEQDPMPCMRFTLEPIEWTHKPLLFYAVCQGLLGGLGTLSLWNEGFSRHRAGVYNYWVRVPESDEARQRTPIVFVHGIGVGLVMYLSMIKELLKHDCPIVCVELPWISSNLAPEARNVPSINEQVQSIEAICDRWGFRKAMFVGHSYGSVLLSWMAQRLPARVAGLVFIDPVVMMLNLKKILYNFLYKHERDGKISDLVGTELHINNALRRNFWWYANIVWASDLQRAELPSLVCLSEEDEIVPSGAVQRHIQQHAAKAGNDNLVDSYMMRGANHGEMLFDDKLMSALSERIGEHYATVEKRERSSLSWAWQPAVVGFPRSLSNVMLVWQTQVQLRWTARRVSGAVRVLTSQAVHFSQPLVAFVKRLSIRLPA